MRSIAEAICSRMARDGQVHAGHQHHRLQARERVARACWRGRWSASRRGRCSSPAACPAPRRRGTRRRRCGRAACAAQLRTRSRMVTAPLPSMFGGRGFQADHVLLLELQLGGVLDRDDALVVGDEARTARSAAWSCRSRCRRRRRCSAGLRRRPARKSAISCGQRAELDQVARPSSGSLANLRMVRHGPFRCQRRDDGVDAASRPAGGRPPSGELSSMRRPSGATIRSMMRITWCVVAKMHVASDQLALALDVDLVRAVDHDLGDGLVLPAAARSGHSPASRPPLR